MNWSDHQSSANSGGRKCKYQGYNPAEQDLRRRSIDGLDMDAAALKIMCQEFEDDVGAGRGKKAKRRGSNSSLHSLNDIPLDTLFDDLKAAKCVSSNAAIQLLAKQLDDAGSDDDSDVEEEKISGRSEENSKNSSGLNNLLGGLWGRGKGSAQGHSTGNSNQACGQTNLWNRERRSSIGQKSVASEEGYIHANLWQREKRASLDHRPANLKGECRGQKQEQKKNQRGFWSTMMNALDEEKVVVDQKRKASGDSRTLSTVATSEAGGKVEEEGGVVYDFWGAKKKHDDSDTGKSPNGGMGAPSNSLTKQASGRGHSASNTPNKARISPLQERMEAKRMIDSVPTEIFLTSRQLETTDVGRNRKMAEIALSRTEKELRSIEKTPDIVGSHIECSMFDVECGSSIVGDR